MISSTDNSKMIIQSRVSQKYVISENRLRTLTNQNKILGVDLRMRGIPKLNGVQMNIFVYPNGFNDVTLGQMVISISVLVGQEKNVGTQFIVSIETADFTCKLENYFFKTDQTRHMCCTTEELFDPKKKFIVEGKLILTVEGTFEVEKPVIPMFVAGGDLGDCIWNQGDKDFVIVIGDKELEAHKLILAARSPVFKRMFESNMKEAKENKVVIKDFPYEVVETCIKLCYYQNLTTFFTLETKMLILQFFEKYDIQELKDNFENYLINEIDHSNVCSLIKSSIASNATKLRQKCSDFLINCLKKSEFVNDLETLDKDYVFLLFKNAFTLVSTIV